MAEPKQEQPKTVRVKVAVPRREGFAGYWAIGRHFAEGAHEYEVPADKLEELKAEPMLAVVEVGGAKQTLSEDDKRLAEAAGVTGVSSEPATTADTHERTRRR